MNAPQNYPTSSDISMFMKYIGYNWSNESQIYYDYDFRHISDESAKKIYKRLIGDKPFKDSIFSQNIK